MPTKLKPGWRGSVPGLITVGDGAWDLDCSVHNRISRSEEVLDRVTGNEGLWIEGEVCVAPVVTGASNTLLPGGSDQEWYSRPLSTCKRLWEWFTPRHHLVNKLLITTAIITRLCNWSIVVDRKICRHDPYPGKMNRKHTILIKKSARPLPSDLERLSRSLPNFIINYMFVKS